MTKPFMPLASSAALLLALSQTLSTPAASAAEPPPAPPAQYPATAQPAAPTSTSTSAPTPKPGETARSQIDERRAAMQEKRKQRYDELRASAAERGVEMPETPPWEAAGSDMPAMPALPEMDPRHCMCPDDDTAMRQWREDMQARMRMRAMTPEERQAMREEHWKRMRADAAERGIEMPETPPWEEAQKRRQEMAERFEQYRKTVEQMTDEQREAARALFGHTPPRTAPPMPRQNFDQGYEPWGYPGYGAYPDEPWGMNHPPMMPYQGTPGDKQGPPPWGTGN